MGKRKIGILVLTDKVKDRMTRKNNYFDSLEYAGFKRIINDIDKVKYEVEFCSFYNINNYEFVLWSVISYFDIFNFLNEAKKYTVKTKIVIGGAAVCNIYPLYDYIHAACFGRGETLINKILDGEYLSNVWYKKYDENLTKKYNIGQLIELINIDNYHEKSIGCPNKCRFCQYSWKYNCTSKNNYTSGMDETEELFIDLNWEKAKRRAITAIDGTTEFDRKMVHKNLTGKQIYNKLIEVYNLNYEKPLYLKLFNIVGYPWENENHNFNELRDIFKEADKTKKTHSVWVKIFNNHFKPMPLTPMESEPVNKINYRDKYFNNNKIYMGNNFEVTISPYGTAPHTACEETIVNRMFDSDNLMRIYTNKKYLNLKGKDKLKVFEKYNPEVFEEINNLPTNYLLTPYNLTKQKEVYKKNLLKYK
jgi:radical SAM superfamily enzyme YgiQ (UPF0313 family)